MSRKTFVTAAEYKRNSAIKLGREPIGTWGGYLRYLSLNGDKMFTIRKTYREHGYGYMSNDFKAYFHRFGIIWPCKIYAPSLVTERGSAGEGCDIKGTTEFLSPWRPRNRLGVTKKQKENV